MNGLSLDAGSVRAYGVSFNIRNVFSIALYKHAPMSCVHTENTNDGLKTATEYRLNLRIRHNKIGYSVSLPRAMFINLLAEYSASSSSYTALTTVSAAPDRSSTSPHRNPD